MDHSKQNINYKEISFMGKPLFLFVNHRVSLICWNKIKTISGKCDVITFDSHRDFREGFIFELDPDRTFSSKYHKYPHPPFFLCKEFLEWDLSNEKQNTSFMKDGKKYLTLLNDNHIDVAFMKDVVKDVFWYYKITGNDHNESLKCEDFEGKDHYYYPNKVYNFRIPKSKFILDIDLDFFVNCMDFRRNLLPIKQIKKYVKLIKRIANNKNCMAITIALEPGCCGSEQNCLKILRELSVGLEIDLNKEIENSL